MSLINIEDLYAKYLSSKAEHADKRETLASRPIYNGRKPVSPRKVVLRTQFGKITYKELMFYREMNGTNIIGDYEHKMTMDGCTCHKDYDIFPIKKAANDELVIEERDLQREIQFRLQEQAENAKIPCLSDDSEDDENTRIILQL